MNWIKSIFSKESDQQLKMKFSKQNDSWMVVRNQDIVFIGDENQCKEYMKNFENPKEQNL